MAGQFVSPLSDGIQLHRVSPMSDNEWIPIHTSRREEARPDIDLLRSDDKVALWPHPMLSLGKVLHQDVTGVKLILEFDDCSSAFYISS